MPEFLRTAAAENRITIERLYLAACKGDPKMVLYSEVTDWEDADPLIRTVIEKHVYQFAESAESETAFAARFTGEACDISALLPGGFRGRAETPTVELLEAMADANAGQERLQALGDHLAYKHLTNITARPSLLAVAVLSAAGRRHALVTVCDLEPEKTEAYFDEAKNRFSTAVLTNIIGRTAISRAAAYPCLDGAGEEVGDLWVYTSSASPSWWQTTECERELPARKEARTLMALIAHNVSDSVPPAFFEKLQEDLSAHPGGIGADALADSLESRGGVEIRREQLREEWGRAFGDPDYQPRPEKIYGSASLRAKLLTGDIELRCLPRDLGQVRQVIMGTDSYLVIRVPQLAHVAVGKDQEIGIQSLTLQELITWMTPK